MDRMVLTLDADKVDRFAEIIQQMLDEGAEGRLIITMPEAGNPIEKRYTYYDDVPTWYREALDKVMPYINGKGDDVLDVGEDALWLLTILDRYGILDRKD